VAYKPWKKDGLRPWQLKRVPAFWPVFSSPLCFDDYAKNSLLLTHKLIFFMKLIHTADWHLGQLFYQNNREEEHEFFFQQLINIIKEEKPDALVVSGDIFHTASPTVTSQRQYYHLLVELSKIDEDLQVIIVAGNHDSPSRLEAPRELLNAFNVSVVGSLGYLYAGEDQERMPDLNKMIVPITRVKKLIGWVLAVPFITPGNYPALASDDSYENRVASFYASLILKLKQNQSFDGQPIVTTGHMLVKGSDLSGHDEKIIGGVESVDGSILSALNDLDYWALGHIHHAQYVGKNNTMRYSGSPFAISFDENYGHSVSVVSIDHHHASIETKAIKPLVPILDFPNKPKSYKDALPYETLLLKLHELPDEKVYVRLHILMDRPLTPNESAAITSAFEGQKAILCKIQSYSPPLSDANADFNVKTISELKALSPFDLGCEVYERKNGRPMPEEMRILFKGVCENVNNKRLCENENTENQHQQPELH
jgi:exonuclease SbcD